MLHECNGLQDKDVAKQQAAWAQRFADWGCVSLQVDSFGPRGVDSVCDRAMAVSDRMRTNDAFAAKAYLAGLRFVESNRIAVIGWSHGAWTIMCIIDANNGSENFKPFQAAVVFYPWCDSSKKRDTPLLILIGEKDKVFPAKRWDFRVDGTLNNATYELLLKVYTIAGHSFDFEGLNGYDPEAAADAIEQTKNFLVKYLKAAD